VSRRTHVPEASGSDRVRASRRAWRASGGTYKTVALTAEDAQSLEAVKFAGNDQTDSGVFLRLLRAERRRLDSLLPIARRAPVINQN
jgi:hypothetical protein